MATTTHEAAAANEDKVLEERKQWLENGTDINARDGDGRTGLHHAARRDHVKVADFLLGRQGIDCNATDHCGWTPLMCAVFSGHENVARRLLIKGAAVDTTNSNGETALHLAVKSPWDIEKMVRVTRLLLSYGANPHKQDGAKKTPLTIAKENEENLDLAVYPAVHLELLSHDFPKRIIVCCDGTWNDRETKQPFTNVAKLLSCIAPGSCEMNRTTMRYQQSVHYLDGIGTGTTWLGQRIDGAMGISISRKIREAYRVICENYTSPRDQIILIGFSRGAFTIQCLARLIDDIGLCHASWTASNDFLELFDCWSTGKHVKPTQDGCQTELETWRQKLRDKGHLRQGVKINAYAAWDTVAALRGSWSILHPLRWPEEPFAFVGNRIPSCVLKAYQALALEEQRSSFIPVILTGPADKIEQCWFLGSHGDVGGGCDESGLANISLCWMISKLCGHVYFEKQVITKLLTHVPKRTNPSGSGNEEMSEIGPEIVSSAYNSLTGWWRLLGSKPRQLGGVPDSRQGVHFTVKGAKRTIPSLQGFEFSSGNQARSWKKGDTEVIDELRANPQEIELLNEWLTRHTMRSEMDLQSVVTNNAPLNENGWSEALLYSLMNAEQLERWRHDMGFD